MLDVGQRVEFERHQVKRLQLICDYLVGAFEECIGLGIGCGHDYHLDTIELEEFLELNTSEFDSFVMKIDGGSWVVTEPGAIKGMSHSAAFFIWNNNQLE
jgi:hypothetical protein